MNPERNALLRRLRPPFTAATKVAYPFSRTSPTNFGLTCNTYVGQILVAPGDGKIELIAPVGSKWRNDIGVVRSTAIRIDHGYGIKTWVHGIGQVLATLGTVTRGQLLGYASHTQAFVAMELNGNLVDPTLLNRSFWLMDGALVPGKALNVRQSPDLVTTSVTTTQSLMYQSFRYFVPS